MTPGMRHGQVPPFYEMGEFKFQELCRDLLDAEPEISVCEVYGHRGEKQEGIDLLAYRLHDDGIEVGQCKCHRDFPPRKIREASDKFWTHWDKWSNRNVKRFILLVACDLSSRKRQDEISKQKELFRQHEITYEAWSAAKIQNKLRPHRGIVSSYCHPADYWLEAICGTPRVQSFPPQTVETEAIGSFSSALLSELEDLKVRLSQQMEKRLEDMRESWRNGRKTLACESLREIRTDRSGWIKLLPDVRAKILRFEASLELDKDNIVKAKQLAKQAGKLAPEDDHSRLHAMIAYKEYGPGIAIQQLRSSTEIDNLNLRAALMLEMGQCDQTRALLSTAEAPNAETFRLLALTHLLERDLGQARLNIQKAQEIAPAWVSIQLDAARINYFSACSPVALANVSSAWPIPMPFAFMKQDTGSLTQLRSAERIFRNSLQATDLDKEKRRILETWRLACLACDPDSQEEAIGFCHELLTQHPGHLGAFSWAMARSFPFDPAASIESLREIVESPQSTLDDIVTLFIYYLANNEGKEAQRLLDSTKQVFEKAQAPWKLYSAQAQSVSGNYEMALSLLTDVEGREPEVIRVKTLVLKEMGEKTGDWTQLKAHLETSYELTNDAMFLYDCCDLSARQQQWDYVADRGADLINRVNSSEAVRLASIAAFNSKRYQMCLEFLDNYLKLFYNERLPSQLRALRASCQQRLGDLPAAAAEAEVLAQNEPTTDNLWNLADIYFGKGDLKNCAIVAQRLLSHADLTPEQLLQLARRVQHEDQTLACNLWRKATDEEISDDLVAEAFNLAFQLGLDRETEHLSQRMAQLAAKKKGGVQTVSLQQFAEMSRARQKALRLYDEEYKAGHWPIHLIVEPLGSSLPFFYHQQLALNEEEPSPRNQFALLARHGSRALPTGFPETIPEWEIHVDLTSLLLAAHLDILSQVEAVFKPLQIPASLIRALISAREKSLPSQPLRIQKLQGIIKLLERGSLLPLTCEPPEDYEDKQLVAKFGKDWVALFEEARRTSAFLVDSLPVTQRVSNASILPEEVDTYLVNCRAILESLRQNGPLSLDQYEMALSALGTEGTQPSSKATPPLGAVLLCRQNIPEVLANANLLEIACKHFQVFLPESYIEHLRSDLDHSFHEEQTAQWLSDLIERISQGIEKNIYQQMPEPLVNPEEESDGTLPPIPIELRCLLELFQHPMRPDLAIWIDDRYATSFRHSGPAVILGINEILKVLVSKGALSRPEYYNRLNRLRASNVRFVPLQKDEILHHLEQARVDNDRLIETRELAILRRHIADCLLRTNELQKPTNSSSDEMAELSFVQNLSTEILQAMCEIWTSGDDIGKCIAKADWLLTELYLDDVSLCETIRHRKRKKDRQYLVAVTLTRLIGIGLQIAVLDSTQRSSRCKTCYGWLQNRLLRYRFEAERYLIGIVAKILKEHVGGLQRELSEQLDEKQLRGTTAILQTFFDSLPTDLKEELSRDDSFIARLGIRTEIVVRILDLNFDRDEFLLAVQEVLGGRTVNIRLSRSSERVVLKPIANKPDSFALIKPGEKKEIPIDLDVLKLLLDSPSAREQVLRRNRDWFDCVNEDFEAAVSQIATYSDPIMRIEECESWREKSAPLFYEKLSYSLRSKPEFAFRDLLPPTGEALVKHLRFVDDGIGKESVRKVLDASGQTLCLEEGVAEAIRRLAGLPVSLPVSVASVIMKLTISERRRLIKELLRGAGSPVSQFHLLRILLDHHADSPSYQRLARRLIIRLLGPENRAATRSFLVILHWVEDEFRRWSDTDRWSQELRMILVWLHAHRIFCILRSPCEAALASRDFWSCSTVLGGIIRQV